MSDLRLPPETLDYIVDHLHDTGDGLKSCCLASKSWIPRTRKHLFADIGFPTAKSLEAWKETFPDPSTSPACYANTLSVDCPHVVTTADAEEGGWIRGFSRVTHLEVDSDGLLVDARSFSLVPFHGFSPVLKSLRVDIPTISSREVFGLVLSFPLLEDLAVMVQYETPADDGNDPGKDETPTAAQLSSPPMFTGSLRLLLGRGTKQFVYRLLSLPGGIHFRKLTLTWLHEEGIPLVAGLVEECSRTLESLDITGTLLSTSFSFCVRTGNLLLSLGGSLSALIDLSKATKLKDVAFQLNSWSVEWVIAALRTASKHRDLQHISIYVPHELTFGGSHPTMHRQWVDLDHLLVQFWESRSIRPKVVFTKQGMGDYVKRILKETTGRGIIDLVECSG
jgi:hypothetical protein